MRTRLAWTQKSPHAAGFDAACTEQSILFQQWGGLTGLTAVKRIALTDIQAEPLITFGASTRIVIRTNGSKYDSFAVSDGTGEISIRAGTTDIYEVLIAQRAILKSRP